MYKLNQKRGYVLDNVVVGVFLALMGFAMGGYIFLHLANLYAKDDSLTYTQTAVLDVQEALESGGLVIDGKEGVFLGSEPVDPENGQTEPYSVQPATGWRAIQPTYDPQGVR